MVAFRLVRLVPLANIYICINIFINIYVYSRIFIYMGCSSHSLRSNISDCGLIERGVYITNKLIGGLC